jgi:sigma-B regulation protein RsbU (phosphoserine phosphatase)
MLIQDVRRLLRLNTTDAHPPGRTLTQINRYVLQRIPSFRFVTFSLVTVDRSTLELQYATAGQPIYRLPALGPIERLECDNGPLGIFDDEVYDTGEAGALSPGESLVLLTDGLREALDASHQMYGDARLQHLLETRRDCELSTIVDELVDDVHAHVGDSGAFDDLTIAMMRLTPRQGSPAAFR